MLNSAQGLTEAQNELYEWIKEYMKNFQHSPSIRQMIQAMGLKSPAPIQSRLRHLQEKGFISWQEGKARTLQIVDELVGCLLYTSPSPRDISGSRMPSSA